MPELHIIKNKYHDLYYHSILPRGRVLWCESAEDAQYLFYDEAKDLINRFDLSADICLIGEE